MFAFSFSLISSIQYYKNSFQFNSVVLAKIYKNLIGKIKNPIYVYVGIYVCNCTYEVLQMQKINKIEK
jgi:hypothetical protein